MSSIPDIPKHRLRDGTGQQQRIPGALRPEYIAVDERSREDLLAFAQALAAEIYYYDAENEPDGKWEAFFMDEMADSAPHKALFLCFLELFRYAQEHINTFTRRHLDFYYREVLRLKEKPATPDQVHVLFQLAKDVQSHLLKAGTLLKAGKDSTGTPLYYAIEKDIVINKATIADLKTLFVEKDNEDTQNIWAAPVADSADGLGAPFKEEKPQWPIFGDTLTGAQADIGFAIASPLLFLSEGERRIDMLFTFSDPVPAEVNGLVMAQTFDIQLSIGDGWITGTFEDYNSFTTELLTEYQIGITVTFSAAQPAITAYNKEIHGGRFNTIWPLMKILLKDHSCYDLLHDLKLQNIGLTVHVSGLKTLVLQNDQGLLDPASPFPPFGTQPVLGSSFYIGSGEVFKKKLDSLTFHIDWHGLPQDDLIGYYTDYGGSNNFTLDNSIFKADILLLKNQIWKLLLSDEGLFVLYNADTDEGAKAQKIIGLNDTDLTISERNANLKEVKSYDSTTQEGFIKLELTGPLFSGGDIMPINAFGHAEYPNLYTEQAIALSKYNVDPMDPAYDPPTLPNTPYTPTIKSLSLDYSSTQVINFELDDNNTEQFFHITPFGHSERLTTPNVPEDIPLLLPQYPDEGSLYIGIRDLVPPQQLSILFRPAEGSAAPENLIRREDIKWSYLSGGAWVKLTPQQILSDTTKAFQDTGIITFAIPQKASVQHSLMPAGLHWLKAAVAPGKGAAGPGKFVALHTQAVTAGFMDRGNDPARLDRALDPGSISRLMEKESEVRSVLQPYASFNGKAAEQSEAFYTRVSERLRHKARAISGWDYERLVLEAFPSIYKVKCLSHTEIDAVNAADGSEDAAGCVTLVTLPGPEHKTSADPLEPKTNNKTLIAIGDYIRKYTSPFVKVNVMNPHYEQVQLRFKVLFTEGADQGYHRQWLEEEVIRFLSPWAYEEGQDIIFGNEIYKSTVLDFVEKRPYVDVVTDFIMYHIFEVDSLPVGTNIQKPGSENIYRVEYLTPPALTLKLPMPVFLEFTVELDTISTILQAGVLITTILNAFLEEEQEEGRLDELQRSAVKARLEQDPEVNFVQDFRLFHIRTDGKLKEDTERAVAARPGALLTSYPTHDITLIDLTEDTCPGFPGIGIGYMIVQGDFVVS